MERGFEAVFRLRDEVTSPLSKIIGTLNSIQNKAVQVPLKVTTGEPFRQINQQTKRTSEFIQTTLASDFDTLDYEFSEIGTEIEEVFDESKTKGFFDSIHSGMDSLISALNEAKYLIAGTLLTGAVGGISFFKSKREAEMLMVLKARMEKKNINTADIEQFIAEAVETGFTTGSRRVESLDVLMARTKLTGPRMAEAVIGAENMLYSKMGLKLRDQFSTSAEMFSAITAGRIGPGVAMALADATGKTYKQIMKMTPEARVRLISRKGGEVTEDMKREFMDMHPEIRLETDLSRFRSDMGDAMVGPMTFLTDKAADFVEIMTSIPGAAPIAAFGTAAATSGMGMVSMVALIPDTKKGLQEIGGALSRLVFGQKAVEGATKASTIATVANTVVTKANAVAQYILTLATRLTGISFVTLAVSESTASAATATAGATAGVASTGFWAMAASVWAVLAPILFIVLPLAVLAGALYLVEKRTHIFSNALKTLSRTQMARDFFAWFERFGDWINKSIKWLDQLYKTGNITGALKKGIETILFGITLPFNILLKPLLLVVGYLFNLIGGTEKVSDFIEYGVSLLKIIGQFLTSLWNTLKDFWNWLVGVMPGAKKATAEEDLKKAIGKLPIGYEGGLTFKGHKIEGTTPENQIASLMKFAEQAGTPISEAKAKSIVESQQKYERAPNFWKDLATSIAQAISDKLGITPILEKLNATLDKLSPAIEGLLAFLEGIPWVGDVVKAAEEGITQIKESIWNKPTSITGVGTMEEEMPPIPITDLEKYKFNELVVKGKYQAGTDFVPSTGLYQLERGEKVIPAGGGRNEMSNIRVDLGGIKIEKVSSTTDLDKLGRFVEQAATKAIRTALAQRRT